MLRAEAHRRTLDAVLYICIKAAWLEWPTSSVGRSRPPARGCRNIFFSLQQAYPQHALPFTATKQQEERLSSEHRGQRPMHRWLSFGGREITEAREKRAKGRMLPPCQAPPHLRVDRPSLLRLSSSHDARQSVAHVHTAALSSRGASAAKELRARRKKRRAIAPPRTAL